MVVAVNERLLRGTTRYKCTFPDAYVVDTSRVTARTYLSCVYFVGHKVIIIYYPMC